MKQKNFVFVCNNCYTPEIFIDRCFACGKSSENKGLVMVQYCQKCANEEGNVCCICGAPDAQIALKICFGCNEDMCYKCRTSI